jgi:hypothetical protein
MPPLRRRIVAAAIAAIAATREMFILNRNREQKK